MPTSSALDQFLEKILHIRIWRWGGAATGISGSTGSDSDSLNSLRKSAIAFAGEYRKSSRSRAELEKLSNDIDGFIQTLQLTNTLSGDEANKLIEQLQKLMDKTAR